MTKQYRPQSSRFTQEDPVKDGGNWYGYVGNNPLNAVDPLGLMNYFTQTDNLLSGIWQGVKDNTIGVIQSLPQAIPMLTELIKGVAGGQINIVDLVKALLSSMVADYWHVISNIGTLNPFQKNTDAEVYRYGQAVGRVGTEIVLAMAGATIADKAMKLLKGSSVGKKIISLANQARDAFQDYSCKAAASFNRALDGIADAGGNLARTLRAGKVMSVTNAIKKILNGQRTGSALKADIYHRAASYLSSSQLARGQTFNLMGNDGLARTVLQVGGTLNNKTGIFEYIIEANGTISHQLFKPGGIINGIPN